MSASNWLTDFKLGGGGGMRQLPLGWEQGFDQKSGRIYYFNRQTQQSSWDVPSLDMVVPQGQVASRTGQQPQRDMQMQRNTALQRDMTMLQGGGDLSGEIGSVVRSSQRNQMDNARSWHDGAAPSSGERHGRGGWGSSARVGNWSDDKEPDDRSGARGKDSDGYQKGGKGERVGRSSWGQQSERYSREGDEEPRERHQQNTGLVFLRGRGLGDDDLPNDRMFSGQCRGAEEINFAENYITGTGLAWLFRPIQQFQYLRVIKLHKNNIGDSAADPLVRLCRNAPALCEMHLSHNQITWVGADKIVPAACERQILKSVEKREPCLWLRLEQNQIEDAKQLFDDWVARGLQVSLYHKSDSRSPPKGVIMPYFTSQRTVALGRGSARYDKDAHSWEAWEWSASYGPDWAEWNAWETEESWGWDSQHTHSYSTKGKGKSKSTQGRDVGGTDKGGKSNKGAQKGKDASGKGKSIDAHKEKDVSRTVIANKGLNDGDLENFCAKQREKSKEGVDQLDLALNRLVGGAPFQFLTNYCMDLANLSIIKLHKNLLSDEVAPYLAQMCSGGCRALRELHLSHNFITKTGAEEIVSAACNARADNEEADGDEDAKMSPLWLRLEYNEISEPQALVDDWRSRNLCIIPYTKGPSRHNLPPGVHLPYFFAQGKPSGYVHSSEAASKDTAIIEQKAERSRTTTKANDSEKKVQLKWKPKKKPDAEVETRTAESEENAEPKEEAPKPKAEGKGEKGEALAEETNVSDNRKSKDEVEAGHGEEYREKQEGRKGQRRSADDDADATVFSSGEDSQGSK